MTQLSGKARATYVREMFARIAGRYDLMNRLMTAGQDRRWRRDVVRLARVAAGDYVLDLGAGTGDMAREALHQEADANVIAADFTLAMMRAGKRAEGLQWCAADALHLPFSDNAFEAVVSGFLMRNVIDVDAALREQYRVVRGGGRIVILDTTRPRRNLLSPLIWLHMHVVIPALGRLIAGTPQAYSYLSDSTERFLEAEELARRMTACGFRQVEFKIMMFGTIAIHSGQREA